MKNEFKEDLEKLVQIAYDTGHGAAVWEDGGSTNEIYYREQEDYQTAVKSFLEKYNDKITNSKSE